MFWCC